MPLILRPPGDAMPLVDQLRSLGQARKTARVSAGVFWLLALVPLGVAVAAGLDVWLHTSAAVRALLLVGLLGGAVVLFARGIRRPAREASDALSTAHRLESRYPYLNDAVASAVSFQQLEEAGTAPGADRFRRVAVVRATNLSEKYEFDDLVPAGSAWRAFVALLVAGVGVGGIAVAAGPERMAFALARLAAPFGNRPWPADTRVTILHPDKSPALLARGDPFEVTFNVEGVIPPHATVEILPAGGSVTTEPVELEGTGVVRVTVKIDAGRVGRDFDFRVVANDGDTGWHPVRVLPPPKLVPLNGRPSPQVSLSFPAYTHQQPLPLPDGAGVIEAVAGTRVRLRAAVDRRIVSAVLVNQTDLTTLLPIQAIAPAAGMNPFAALGSALLADEYTTPIPVPTVDPDGRLLDATFVPPLPGLYALRFTDEDGLTGTRLFDVRTYPDPSPTVSLERPIAGTDPLTVLPTSKVTVRVRAEDRLFAARTVSIEYAVGDGPMTPVPLVDVSAVSRLVPAVAGGPATTDPQPASLAGNRVIPVADFARPDGRPPQDGDTITLVGVGSDWDDRTVGKAPGRSSPLVLRVFAPASFDALIQKELGNLRPDLARQLDAQKDAAAKLDELRKALPKDGVLTPEQRDQLAKLEQLQKDIQAKIGDPRDGQRAKADQLRDMIRGNELPRTPVTERAEAVAKALGRADEQHLPNVTNPLTAARQAAEAAKPDPKATADALAQAAKAQKAAADALTDALQRLERWAGPGELRGDVRGVKEQVTKAGAGAEKAQAPAGKSPDALSPAERAALNQAADKFDKAAADADATVGKTARVADERAKQADALKAAADKAKADADAAAGTPQAAEKQAAADAAATAAKQAAAEAAALKEAVEQSGGQALPNDLKKAADATRANRPGEADAARQAAEAKLDAMRDKLAEKPTGETQDELRKKTKQAAAELDKLTDQQDELQKKIKDAAAKPDAEERADELKKLAAEQEKLEQEAEKLARKLDETGNDAAAEKLRRAAEQMEANRQQLDQGMPPGTAQQEEALERLDEAREKLEKENKQEQDQLDREKREQVAKEFEALVEKQKAAVAEADRIQAAALAAKKWDRPLQTSLARLADREKELAEAVRGYATKNLAELKVFDRLARQAADQMDRAARRLADRKDDALTADPATFDPETEKLVGESVRGPMAVALKRLQMVVDSTKPDAKKDQPPPAPMGGGGEGGGGGGGMPPGGGAGGIPPLAQLKALRDWQTDVNERTTTFHKTHPDAAKLTDDEKEDLRDLERSQREIGELFDQLLPLFQKPAGG